MRKFTSICPNCGEHSDENYEECTICGAIKTERLQGLGFFESLFRYFANNYHLSKNLQFIIFTGFQLILNLILLFIFPKFISKSSIFLIIFIFYSVSHISLVADFHFFGKKSLFSKISKIVILAYLGAGLGILITNMGLNRFLSISECFTFSVIWNEIVSGRSFPIFFGSFLIISIYLVFSLVIKDLRDNED